MLCDNVGGVCREPKGRQICSPRRGVIGSADIGLLYRSLKQMQGNELANVVKEARRDGAV